jgi:hypothetical protein
MDRFQSLDPSSSAQIKSEPYKPVRKSGHRIKILRSKISPRIKPFWPLDFQSTAENKPLTSILHCASNGPPSSSSCEVNRAVSVPILRWCPPNRSPSNRWSLPCQVSSRSLAPQRSWGGPPGEQRTKVIPLFLSRRGVAFPEPPRHKQIRGVSLLAKATVRMWWRGTRREKATVTGIWLVPKDHRTSHHGPPPQRLSRQATRGRASTSRGGVLDWQQLSTEVEFSSMGKRKGKTRDVFIGPSRIRVEGKMRISEADLRS